MTRITYDLPGYDDRYFSPLYTVVHHTAGTDSLRLCMYGRGLPNPLPGPLCQFLIPKDGTVHHITSGYANHVGAAKPGFSNSNCVGIELENLGDGNDPYPEVQLEAARQLCRELGFPVYGHKEICDPPGRKIDPSFDMDAFRASLIPEDDLLSALTDDEQRELLNKTRDLHAHMSLQDKVNPLATSGDGVNTLGQVVGEIQTAIKNASNQSGGTWPSAADIAKALIAELSA